MFPKKAACPPALAAAEMRWAAPSVMGHNARGASVMDRPQPRTYKLPPAAVGKDYYVLARRVARQGAAWTGTAQAAVPVIKKINRCEGSLRRY